MKEWILRKLNRLLNGKLMIIPCYTLSAEEERAIAYGEAICHQYEAYMEWEGMGELEGMY